MSRNDDKSNHVEDLTQGLILRAKVLDFFKIHRIWMVIGTMVGIWIVLGFVVYRLEVGAEGSNIKSFGDGLWWGIVTFLTVGYGDRYPVTPEGRMMASLLMVCGVIVISIITAQVASVFLKEALLEGRGIVDRSRIKDHLIVCGWKDDMQDILLHIMQFNPELTSESVVLIANITQEMCEELRGAPTLKDLKIIMGEFFHEATLKRAAPEKARKILILADRSPGQSGMRPNDAEADARTIMTAITLSNIARGTIVTAEILDPKMDHYLKMAGVSEVIYSREYSRLLIGNASHGSGVSNVIYDLLDPNSPGFIFMETIDDALLGRSYAEFKTQYEAKHPHSVVVGILENNGNPYRMRELALREAQKTANVNNLITNLKAVKTLRCNKPVFHPPGEYRLVAGSAAIVILSSLDQKVAS